MYKRFTEIAFVVILFLWTWPGIENTPILQENRLLILGIVVLSILLRDWLIFLLVSLWRTLIRKFIKVFRSIENVLNPDKPSTNNGNEVFFIPATSTSPKNNHHSINKIFSLWEYRTTRIFVQPINSEKIGTNNTWEMGLLFAKSTNIGKYTDYGKPLYYLEKYLDEDGYTSNLRFVHYSGGFSKTPEIVEISSNYKDEPLEISCIYRYDGIHITIKKKLNTIYECTVPNKYKYFKFTIWCKSQKSSPQFNTQRNKYEWKILNPLSFDLSYESK